MMYENQGFNSLAEQVCRDYLIHFSDKREEVRHQLDAYGIAIFSDLYGVPPVSVFHVMLDPIFMDHPMRSHHHGVFMPVAYVAICNPACPSILLALAAGSRHEMYRDAARQNPSCPEEHEVYVALWRGSKTGIK